MAFMILEKNKGLSGTVKILAEVPAESQVHDFLKNYPDDLGNLQVLQQVAVKKGFYYLLVLDIAVCGTAYFIYGPLDNAACLTRKVYDDVDDGKNFVYRRISALPWKIRKDRTISY